MSLLPRYLCIALLTCLVTCTFIDTTVARQDNPLTQSSEYATQNETNTVDEAAVEKLRDMTPGEIEELDRKLARALTLYYDNEFGKALPLFNAVADRVETMDIMWWIGTSAMKTGQMELAIKKFTAMLAVNPNLHRVRLELATIYFQMGQYEKAREEITTVQQANPPEAVQRNIERFLAAIDERTRKAFWNVRLSQGIMYDTNASSGPGNRELSVIGGTLTLGDESKQIRDEALVTSLSGNYLYDCGKRQGFMWNTDMSLYNSAYLSHSQFNFFMIDVATGPWWTGRQDIVKVPAGYREQYYESERLSHIFHVDPSYEHFFTQYVSIKGNYSYSKEFFYKTSNASLDNITHTYEITPSLYLADRMHTLSATVGWEDRNADGRKYSYDSYYYALSYLLSLPTKTNFFVSYKWARKDYKEKPTFYNYAREDLQDTITAVLSQELPKGFSLSGAINYTDNNSNASLYEYEKATYTLSLGYAF